MAAPYGWEAVHKRGGGNTITRRADEDLVVRYIFLMRHGGWQLHEIADKLNREGVKTRRGCQWQKWQVKRVLDGPPTYEFDDILLEYKQQAIIDLNTHERVIPRFTEYAETKARSGMRTAAQEGEKSQGNRREGVQQASGVSPQAQCRQATRERRAHGADDVQPCSPL